MDIGLKIDEILSVPNSILQDRVIVCSDCKMIIGIGTLYTLDNFFPSEF